MMKTLLLLLSISSLMLQAQTPTVSISSTANLVRPGTTVNLSLTSSGTTTTANGSLSPTGIQWVLSTPVGATPPTITIGAAAAAATKILYTNPANGGAILIGTNQNIIAPGELAKYSVTVPANATPGPLTFSVPLVLGTTANGTLIVIQAGSPLILTVLSKFDLDGNGIVDKTDLDLAAATVLGQSGSLACSLVDFDGNGTCDVRDMQLLSKAIQGLP